MKVEIDIPDDPTDLTLGAVVVDDTSHYTPAQAAARDLALRDLLEDIGPYRAALQGRQ